MPERLEQYLTQIGKQIRWKRARPILLRELETHALEQLNTCLESGLSQEEAEMETLRQLGDPVEIGQDLDRLHRPKPQWGLLLMTGILVLMGTVLQVFMLSGTGQIDPAKLILLSVFGFGLLATGYFSNYSHLLRYSYMIYCGAIVLALIFLWTLPKGTYYARYVTMLYPVVFALVLCRLRRKGWKGMAFSILAIFPLTVVILLVPRLLNLMVLLISGGILLLTAGWKDWFGVGRKKGMMCTVAALFTGGSALLWMVNDPLAARLYEVFHPEKDPLGYGYMAMTIRSIWESAQPWRAGVLNSQWAWSVLPEGANDAFLVIVIHMLGWIPFFLLIGALTALLLWVMIKTFHQKNIAETFLVSSILTIFMCHMLMSLLLTCGYTVLGAFCPFLKMSAETVLEMGLMGFLLSIFRQKNLPYDGACQSLHHPKRMWKLELVATKS